MKLRKMAFKLSLIAATALWVSPAYICAMETSIPVEQAMPDCSSNCCSTEKAQNEHQAPCQTNAICGIQQNALDSHGFTFNPAPFKHLISYLPISEFDFALLLPVESFDRFESPPRRHPTSEFSSNASSLSPPFLA